MPHLSDECALELMISVIRTVSELLSSDSDSDGCASKYGTYYDNGVISIHPYCWCDGEACPWCGEENRPQFWHRGRDLKIWWYKYIGRGMETNRPITLEDCQAVLRDAASFSETLGLSRALEAIVKPKKHGD